jgi:hypothetical protein
MWEQYVGQERNVKCKKKSFVQMHRSEETVFRNLAHTHMREKRVIKQLGCKSVVWVSLKFNELRYAIPGNLVCIVRR